MNKFKNLIYDLGVFFFAIVIKSFFVFYNGIKVGSDSAFYIDIAHRILGLPAYKDIMAFYYVGYPFFMSIAAFLFGVNSLHLAVVIFQIILSALACVFLFKSILLLLPQKFGTALILTIIFILNFDALLWDSYILTDSMSLSLIIITTYFFLKLFTSKIKPWPFLMVHLILMSCLLITRPTNIVYILICIIYLTVYLFKNLHTRASLYIISAEFLIAVLILLIFAKQFMLFKWFGLFFELYKSGSVIYDRPELAIIRTFNWNTAELTTKFFFIFSVLIKRLIYFWCVTLKSYSLMHNLINLLTLLPLFIAGWISIVVVWFKQRTICTRYIISVILGYWIFHSLTMMDYDFRYRIVIMPFLILLIAQAISTIRGNKNPNNES